MWTCILAWNTQVCASLWGRRGMNPGFPPKRIIMSQNPRRLIYSSRRPKSRQTPGGLRPRLLSSVPRLKLSGRNHRRLPSKTVCDVAAKPGTVTALSACLPRPPASPEGFQGHQPGALHARRRQRHGLPAGRLQQPHGHQADAALEQAGPEGVPGLRRTAKGTQGPRLQSLSVQSYVWTQRLITCCSDRPLVCAGFFFPTFFVHTMQTFVVPSYTHVSIPEIE